MLNFPALPSRINSSKHKSYYKKGALQKPEKEKAIYEDLTGHLKQGGTIFNKKKIYPEKDDQVYELVNI